MQNVLGYFVDGGGWMWIVLGVGLLTVASGALQAFAPRLMDLQASVLALMAGTVFAGLAGSGMNLIQLFGALSSAAEGEREALVYGGLAISFHPLFLALILSSVALLLLTVGATLRRARRAEGGVA